MNIEYPFQFDSRGRTATTLWLDHVHDLIEQLLFTSPGERVNRPDFGAGLLRLPFEPNSPEAGAALQFTCKAELQKWLSDIIELTQLIVTTEDTTIQVSISYRVLATGEYKDHKIERALGTVL